MIEHHEDYRVQHAIISGGGTLAAGAASFNRCVVRDPIRRNKIEILELRGQDEAAKIAKQAMSAASAAIGNLDIPTAADFTRLADRAIKLGNQPDTTDKSTFAPGSYEAGVADRVAELKGWLDAHS